MKNIILENINGQVAQLTLNRPEKNNALNSEVISEFLSALETIEKKPNIRVLIIKANGKSFCAGADLKWLQQTKDFTPEENVQDVANLATLFKHLNALSAVTISLVHGKVLGGGNGIVACSDIAIASNDTSFCFSEVKVGVIPATIAPYVIAAIGERAARRYFLTAEEFAADDALHLQLVQQLTETENLEKIAKEVAEKILQNGPKAVIAAKKFIQKCAHKNNDIESQAIRLLAELRSGNEAQEGLQAFLEKRKPKWG